MIARTRDPWRLASRWILVAVAVATAVYLLSGAADALDHISDAGCDQELFAQCIRIRQQLARVAIAVVAAGLALGSLRAVPLIMAGRLGRWRWCVLAAVVCALLVAIVDPVSHLGDQTQWLGSVLSR